MVIYCISDFEFCGATLPTPAIRSFQSSFVRGLALVGWQDWSESFWWFGGRHNQFS